MKSYRLIGKYAIPKAALLGAAGAMILLHPDFLLSRFFYGLMTGWILLGGALRILEFFLWKGVKSPPAFANLAAGCLILIFGAHMILFARYLVHTTPIFLGGLLLMQGVACFLGACRGSAVQRAVLIPLASLTLAAGGAVLIFTFGFGVGGVPGVAQAAGVALLISCALNLACGLLRRWPRRPCLEGGV